MWRHVASNALTFLIVGLFLVAGVIAWGTREYSTEGPLEAAICLRVESGETMRTVSQSLDEQGAVTSPSIFRMGADYSEKSSQLKAGNFLVPEGASMEEIVDIVTRGGASTCGTSVVYRVGVNQMLAEVRRLDPETERFEELAEFVPAQDETPDIYTEVRDQDDTQYSVVVAEGVTSWQIVQSLESLDVLDGEAAGVPEEGSLAPQNYDVQPGTEVSAILEEMQRRQTAILQEEWAERSDDLPYETPQEALIMASIVEKETGVPEERPQVASVFLNRIERGMRLQTDPTVIYGITEGEGVLGRGLRQSELREATPYNTYVIEGLPPTPIANPGRDAIAAALNPAQTDYVFFVADGTGGHVFAETLDEHNRNVARWREIEAERAANE